MRRVTVTQLKNELSRFLRLVKKGEVVEVLEHSVPIAQIIGPGSSTKSGSTLDRLVRDGVVIRAKQKPDRSFLKEKPVPCKGDALKALMDNREDR